MKAVKDERAFTPGPWKYGMRRDGSAWLSIPVFTVFDEMDEHYQFDVYTREPNLRLMVAAPDLFEALRRLIDLSDECDFVGGQPDVCPGESDPFYGGPCHWCQARAALRKARGDTTD